MARPRIFISSTYYDLRQIRADLDRFIKDLGYETIRNEKGNIPYGKDERLEEYCYKEIEFCDILISIVGGRYGTESSHENASITQMEIKTALELNKPIFVFIEKNVLAEFRTYLSNKENKTIKYHYVDDIRVYEFIEFIDSLPKNNPTQPFETSEDITVYLKEQWAGLFQRFLQDQTRLKEINLLQGIQNTADTLNQLIIFLTEEKKGKDVAIKDILLSNHPAMERLKKLLGVTYRVYFLNRDELDNWLNARSYKKVSEKEWDSPDMEEWVNKKGKKQLLLKVSNTLFDRKGNLKVMNQQDWNDDLIILEITEPKADNVDDLPF
jgi:hypothetical protein